MESPPTMEDTTGHVEIDPLTWDHLYAIDLQNNHQFADELAVDRFEEVEAEEVIQRTSIDAIWGSVFASQQSLPYDEEHAYPLRYSESGLDPYYADVLLNGCSTSPTAPPVTSQDVKVDHQLNNLPLLWQHAGLAGDDKETSSVTLSLDKLKVFFTNVTVTIRSDCVDTVWQALDPDVNRTPNPRLSGPIDLVLQALASLLSSGTGLDNHETSCDTSLREVQLPIYLTTSEQLKKNNRISSSNQSAKAVNTKQTIVTKSGRLAHMFASLDKEDTEDDILPNETSEVISRISYKCPDISCSFSSYQVRPVLKHLEKGLHGFKYSKRIWQHQCSLCSFTSSSKYVLQRHFSSIHYHSLCHSAVQTDLSGLTENLTVNDSDDYHQRCPSQMSPVPALSLSPPQLLVPLSTSLASSAGPTLRSGRPTCPQCHLTFSRSDVLKVHQRRVHRTEGQKLRFSCKYCDKSFDQKCQLDDHEIGKHEKVSRFHCSICVPPAVFRTKYNLRMHQRRFHPSSNTRLPPVFLCSHCDKLLSSKHWLKQHIKSQHGPN